jgi:voltage-gated potassium channel
LRDEERKEKFRYFWAHARARSTERDGVFFIHFLRTPSSYTAMRHNRQRQILWLVGLCGFYLALAALLVAVESQYENASIRSVSDAMWYIIVTFATVGYGDMYPVSGSGKLIGAVFVLSSIGIIGFFIGTISTLITDLSERRKMGYGGTDMRGHIVIVGWDTFTRAIAENLIAAKRRVAIIVNQKSHVEEIYEQFPSKNVFALFSLYDQVQNFVKVNMDEATLIFVNTQSDTENLICVLNIKQIYPHAKFLVVIEQSRLKETFYGAGVTYVLSKNDIAAKLVASYIFEPDVADFSNDILTPTASKEHFDIQEYKVLASNPYAGKAYGDIFNDVKTRCGAIAVGVVKIKNGKHHIHKLPPDDLIVDIGDYVLFLLNGEQAESIATLFNVSEGIMPEDIA